MNFWRFLVLPGLVCSGALAAFAGGVAYNISIDTSTLTALGSGYVDIQLNGGGSDALLVNSSIYNIETDGTLGPTTNTGSVTGSLAGSPLPALSNTSFFNDMFEQIDWGNFLNFTACLCGPGVDGVSDTGTTFSVSLYAPDGITPLLTTSIDGSLLHIDINPPDGDVTTTVFPDANGSTWATLAEVDPCPEPSTLILMGLAGVCWTGWVKWSDARRSTGSRAC